MSLRLSRKTTLPLTVPMTGWRFMTKMVTNLLRGPVVTLLPPTSLPQPTEWSSSSELTTMSGNRDSGLIGWLLEDVTGVNGLMRDVTRAQDSGTIPGNAPRTLLTVTAPAQEMTINLSLVRCPVGMETGVSGQSVIPMETKQGIGTVTTQWEGPTRVSAQMMLKLEM